MTDQAELPPDARRRISQSKQGLFTSDLSVSEFALVRDAGFDPVGLVLGCSIYHLGYQPPRYGNSELSTLSQAMYSARELAMARMQNEAEQCRATGIVGVQLQENRHHWNSHTVEFLAIGTAVIPSDEAAPAQPPMPVISFDN